jgi:hypothetical protein
MNPNRIRPHALITILVLCAAAIVVAFASSRHAYQACRQVMLSEDGYGVWSLKSSLFLIVRAQYDFFDGFNTITCEASGFGTHWIGSKGIETLVACMLSLDNTGGNECPRAKYGVTP